MNVHEHGSKLMYDYPKQVKGIRPILDPFDNKRSLVTE